MLFEDFGRDLGKGWVEGELGLGVGVEVVLGLVRMRADSRIVPSRALRAGRAAHKCPLLGCGERD